MLGILLIYWIWKGFTNLALEYDKNKWGYFAIGLASYYGGTFIAGLLVGLLTVFISGVESVQEGSITNPGWNILFGLFGGLICYGVYRLLESKSEKERELSKKDDIDSIGLVDEN